MPQINGTVTLGATGTATAKVANQLAGSLYEFLPTDSFVEFGVIGPAAGGVFASVITGTDILMDDQEISRAARFPVYPDDFTLNDAAAQGERLILKLNNTAAAAALVFYSIKITPLTGAE